MINLNGDLLQAREAAISPDHRAFRYGDGVFETMLFNRGVIHFWEDHYFRLMAAMRILRMEIPMNFSPEFFEEQIESTLEANGIKNEMARVRLQVSRGGSGFYLPDSSANVDFLIQVDQLEGMPYSASAGLSIDIFKDHLKPRQLLSGIKSTNSAIYIIAAIWAKENRVDDALLLNEKKEVVESVRSNLFLVSEDQNQLITPPEDSGCLKGIMRKQLVRLAPKMGLEVVEKAVSPFDLLRVKEIWLCNSIHGVQWVDRYRKNSYTGDLANKMNVMLRAQFI